MKTCNDCGIEYPYLQKAHILAKHKGGTNDKSNIILICPNCHHIRDHDERVAFISKSWTIERRAQQSKLMREQRAKGMRAKANPHTPEAQASRKSSMKKAWIEKDWSERNKKLSKSMKGNKNGVGRSNPPLKYGWSNITPNCIICSMTTRKHKARGMCNACYLKVYRGNPI